MSIDQPPLHESRQVAAVAGALRAGALAILPTDTVYGIVASARDDSAVRRLYGAKGKGESAPLQLLFAPDARLIGEFADLNERASRFINAVGAGGWTAIVSSTIGWESPALAGGRTVGVRIPDAPFVHAVVRELGWPIVASSANRHGGLSPRTFGEAIAEVGGACAEAVDGGELAGIDSTVIDFVSDRPRILREGAIARETVARILGLDSMEVLRSVRP